jgi:hypothetical protein
MNCYNASCMRPDFFLYSWRSSRAIELSVIAIVLWHGLCIDKCWDSSLCRIGSIPSGRTKVEDFRIERLKWNLQGICRMKVWVEFLRSRSCRTWMTQERYPWIVVFCIRPYTMYLKHYVLTKWRDGVKKDEDSIIYVFIMRCCLPSLQEIEYFSVDMGR